MNKIQEFVKTGFNRPEWNEPDFVKDIDKVYNKDPDIIWDLLGLDTTVDDAPFFESVYRKCCKKNQASFSV